MLSKTTIFSKSSFLICFQNIRTFRFINWDLAINGRNSISGNNRDKDAPIFGVADLGVVGDFNKIVPLLKERLQKEMQEK